MQGSEPVTGKMPVPQVLLLKGQYYSLIVIDVLFSVKARWEHPTFVGAKHSGEESISQNQEFIIRMLRPLRPQWGIYKNGMLLGRSRIFILQLSEKIPSNRANTRLTPGTYDYDKEETRSRLLTWGGRSMTAFNPCF